MPLYTLWDVERGRLLGLIEGTPHEDRHQTGFLITDHKVAQDVALDQEQRYGRIVEVASLSSLIVKHYSQAELLLMAERAGRLEAQRSSSSGDASAEF